MKKIILLILCSTFVLAAQTDYMNPVSYSGVKKLGMGGSGVAVVDTRESIFYNPAHIVDISGHYAIPLIHSSWTAGSETMQNISKLSTAGDSKDTVDAYRTIIPSKVGVGAQTSGYWAGDVAFEVASITRHSDTSATAEIRTCVGVSLYGNVHFVRSS